MSPHWIAREISGELQVIAGSHPVQVLNGPRQVGMTSLPRRVLSGYRYVSLDLASTGAMAEARPEELLVRTPPPVLIDEVQ